MKKTYKSMAMITTICFFIVFYGVIVISDNLPKFIKDRTAFKINYSLKPFDFRVDFAKYSFYINGKVITNIKNSSDKLTNTMQKKIYNSTFNIINKTFDVFKNVEDKINNTIQHKVR